MEQRRASPNTIAGYRDSFRLLLNFAQKRLLKAPSTLALPDFDTAFLSEFLGHLEKDRGNSPLTRNARLAAIHSFFRYVAMEEPAYALLCQRVLAMPAKRHVRRLIEYLTRDEVEILLAVPDLSTWIGRRDRALLALAIQTGLRVSELTGLCCQDVALQAGAHVRCEGKGRKQRATPLRRDIVMLLTAWLRERNGQPADVLFPNVHGGRLSRDAVERLLAKHVAEAQARTSALKGRKITPHVLRHTAAMDLLQSGVDRTVIALWLGHESIETTHMYLHADMRMKEEALSHTTPLQEKPGRFRPGDQLLAFLEGL
jgi:site-specific recombinase XerD